MQIPTVPPSDHREKHILYSDSFCLLTSVGFLENNQMKNICFTNIYVCIIIFMKSGWFRGT